MHRIVCNVTTGEISHVDLTVEEIAELEARAAAYVEPVKPAPTKEHGYWISDGHFTKTICEIMRIRSNSPIILHM